MLLLLRLFHLLASAIFLGSIVVVFVWKRHVESANNPRLVASMLESAIVCDRVLTAPSAAIITLTGFALMLADGTRFTDLWLWVSIILWFMGAVLAIRTLVPMLKSMLVMAQAMEIELDCEYRKLARQWNRLALVLIIIPICIYVLAVTKPGG